MASPRSPGNSRSIVAIAKHDSLEVRAMSAKSVECVGFAHPDRHARTRRRRGAMLANLIASAALTLSILIAVVAVSVGLTRADGQARSDSVEIAQR
jgi:hypothetical protein